jgi:hypothetical protein
MEHRSRIYTESGGVVAVVNITDLGDGRLNVAVAVSGGKSRMEPGPWTWDKAADIADEWVKDLLGRDTALASSWFEGLVEP